MRATTIRFTVFTLNIQQSGVKWTTCQSVAEEIGVTTRPCQVKRFLQYCVSQVDLCTRALIRLPIFEDLKHFK